MSVIQFPRKALDQHQKYVECLSYLAEELEKAGLAEAAMFVTAAAGSVAESLLQSPQQASAPVTPLRPLPRP